MFKIIIQVPSTAAFYFAVAAPGSTVFVCPAEAGQVDHAQLWYYRDHAGVEQGPFSMLSMRSWYEAGYFEGGVTVAASYLLSRMLMISKRIQSCWLIKFWHAMFDQNYGVDWSKHGVHHQISFSSR